MKVPEPRRLPSGQWYIQLRLGGKSYPFTYPTSKECRDAARTFKSDYLAGRIEEAPEKKKAPEIPTLGQVIDRYIEKQTPVLSPSTIRGYQGYRDNRFKAYMDVQIDKLPDWQQIINDELQPDDEGSAISPKTLKNAWALVRRALKVEQKMVVSDVTLPKVPVVHKPYLRPDEIIPFIDAIKGDLAEIPALLELHGLRRSEAKGLNWTDVDLTRGKYGVLHVHESMVMGPDGPVQKSTNKNAASTRPVRIVIPRLKELLSEVEDKVGPVVTVSFQTMLRRTKLACERAGVTVVGNHGLRYSCASLAYHLKVPERQLMEMCGWSDYATMHRIYVRIAREDVEAAQDDFSAFFENRGEETKKTE